MLGARVTSGSLQVVWEGPVMSQQPESNRHESPHDADVQQWFQALGPPPVGQVSPRLQAQVRARIEQRQTRWQRWLGLLPLQSPAWAVAWAMVLVLSVAMNFWWGVGRFTASAPEPSSPAWPMSAARLVRQLKPLQEGEIKALAQATFGSQVAALGFAPQDARLTFFRLGTLYTNALAALQGGAVEVARQRLTVLVRALEDIQAPPVLAAYLQELQTLLQSGRYRREEQTAFLGLFEPLYEDAYRQPNAVPVAALFQVGAWLENMALASRVGDTAALRQGATVQHIQRVLRQLGAPREVLEALSRLHALVRAPEMTPTALQTVHTLVMDLQRMLGGVPG